MITGKGSLYARSMNFIIFTFIFHTLIVAYPCQLYLKLILAFQMNISTFLTFD
jgi:hypothetical protein